MRSAQGEILPSAVFNATSRPCEVSSIAICFAVDRSQVSITNRALNWRAGRTKPRVTDDLQPGQVISEKCPECGASLTARPRIQIRADVEPDPSESTVWLVDCAECQRCYNYEPAWDTLWRHDL